ncbi:MAG: Rne/Rng family ribonuclease, partial [Bdellovibrionota bacterium]
LGLVEMTRKRTRDTLTRIMCSSCPYCEGAGRIKSTMTVCYEIVRELIKVISREKVQKIFVYAHPEVSALLCGEDIDIIENLETKFDKAIIIRSENNYHIEQYEIFPQDYA